MKRLLTMFLTVILVVALSACENGSEATPDVNNQESDPGTETSQPAPENNRIVIKFAAQGDNTSATQAVLDAFNASQEDYVVEWIEMTNDSGAMREQLVTSLKAGSSDYDVVSLDVVWAGEFAAAGYIEPIDTYMKDDSLNISDFNAGSIASGKHSAKQYVLPFFPDLGFLYFRKDIVSEEDAAKLAGGNYTWEDLLAMAGTYKGQGGTADGFVFQCKQYEGLICNANEFTANWTAVKDGLEIMKTFVVSDLTPTDILNYDEGTTHASFANGQSVFSRNWPYQWGTIKEEGSIKTDQVDVAPLPGGGTVGGWLLAMNKNSQNKDGAWELMKFIATAEGQKIMSTQGGYLPGFNSTLDDAEVIGSNELLSMPGFKNALTSTIARPVSSDYTKLSDTLQQAIHSYLSDSAGLDETVTIVETALAES